MSRGLRWVGAFDVGGGGGAGGRPLLAEGAEPGVADEVVAGVGDVGAV